RSGPCPGGGGSTSCHRCGGRPASSGRPFSAGRRPAVLRRQAARRVALLPVAARRVPPAPLAARPVWCFERGVALASSLRLLRFLPVVEEDLRHLRGGGHRGDVVRGGRREYA